VLCDLRGWGWVKALVDVANACTGL
jgi:hypothetical protein